jgi:hypothetical protein
VQLQLSPHLTHCRKYVLAHQAESSHRVVVCEVAVTVPDEDLARPEHLENMADLRKHGVGRADDARVTFEETVKDSLASSAMHVWISGWRFRRYPARAFLDAHRRGWKQGSARTRYQPGEVLSPRIRLSVAAIEEDVAGALDQLATGVVCALLRVVDVDLQQIAQVLWTGSEPIPNRLLAVVVVRLRCEVEFAVEHDVG